MRPALLLLSLLAVLAPSFAQSTDFINTVTVCGTSTFAWIRNGFGGCADPDIFVDPSFTRCPSFTYLYFRATIIDPSGGRTVTFHTSCDDTPALCPPGFSYITSTRSGGNPAVISPLTCRRVGALAAAQSSCERLGGTYGSGTGICTNFSCPATGCQASSSNCRLVSSANSGLAPATCTAFGSICLNASNNLEYRCGIPCGVAGCYDDAGVQICDAQFRRCSLYSSGQRIAIGVNDVLICLIPVSGLTPCSVGFAREGGYECLDVQTELESCGGCRSTGAGIDCSALPGVRVGATTCDEGECLVSACQTGFSLEEGRCI